MSSSPRPGTGTGWGAGEQRQLGGRGRASRPSGGGGDESAPPDPRKGAQVNPGRCRVCKVKVPGSRQYCDEHRPPKGRRPRQPKAETVTAKPTARDVVHALPPPVKRVTNEATAKFLATVLFYIALVVVVAFVDRALPGEADERKEAYVADLQLSKESATTLARPIARFIGPTAVWQRVGPALVGNTDAIDALVVVYDFISGLLRFRRRLARPSAPAPVVEPASNGQGWHRPEGWGAMPSSEDIARIRRERNQ